MDIWLPTLIAVARPIAERSLTSTKLSVIDKVGFPGPLARVAVDVRSPTIPPSGRAGLDPPAAQVERWADMGIDAVLESDSREVLASVADRRMVLARATATHFADTRLLKYLVPWGDTVFNQKQADDVLADIRLFVEANPGSPISHHLLEIQPLAERLASETHAYLWFRGD